MYDRVIFYNHFGAGDVFESREFVKEWKRLVPAKEYFYSHGKHPRILLDMEWLQYKEPTQFMDPMRGVWDDLNGNLYVNTWIGRDGRYVLPGVGCTVEQLYRMHNDLLKVYNLGELSGKPFEYIPDIEYEAYNLIPCNNFLYDVEDDVIFVDNGMVQSKQAHNFDMNPCIAEVAKNHPRKTFIVTHGFDKAPDNVEFTSTITRQAGFDLNEVSYLSLFCRVLIGRNSGPHVYTQVWKNVNAPEKKLLSFTYQQQGSSFVVNTDVKIQKIWSPATDLRGVIQEIERAIG